MLHQCKYDGDLVIQQPVRRAVFTCPEPFPWSWTGSTSPAGRASRWKPFPKCWSLCCNRCHGRKRSAWRGGKERMYEYPSTGDPKPHPAALHRGGPGGPVPHFFRRGSQPFPALVPGEEPGGGPGLLQRALCPRVRQGPGLRLRHLPQGGQRAHRLCQRGDRAPGTLATACAKSSGAGALSQKPPGRCWPRWSGTACPLSPPPTTGRTPAAAG